MFYSSLYNFLFFYFDVNNTSLSYTHTLAPLKKNATLLYLSHTLAPLKNTAILLYSLFLSSGGFCQTFTYPPSVKRRAKYMKRAKAEAYAPNATGKMVHYKVPTPDDGKLLTFFVAVRKDYDPKD